ncbi:hypothetical protein A4X13_0g1452 [Tilletia indica]|uniref:Uncharacterized protein n=1 Tax=Tilletia indica TaxID=43049 RepID=A0A177TQA7_9BASI|nr:hypothetical protein A4X13_0g1452 [Tilletia indica]
MPHKRAKRSVREADRFAKGQDLAPSGTGSKDGFFGGLPKGAMRVIMGAKAQADYQERRRAAADPKRIGGGPSSAKSSPDVKGKGKATSKKSAAPAAGESVSTKKDGAKHELKLLPGETLGNFNRRVEKTLAADITASLRAAATTSEKRSNKKRKASAIDEEEEDAGEAKAKSAEKAAARAALEPSSQDLKREREALLQQQQRRKHSGPEPGGEPIKDWAKVDQRRRLDDIATAPPRFTKVPKARGNPAVPAKAVSTAASSLRDSFEVEAPAGAELDSDDDREDGSRRKKSKGAGGVARAVSRGRPEKKASTSTSAGKPAMAPVRERALAKEREDAIERYRALKEARLQKRNGSTSTTAAG